LYLWGISPILQYQKCILTASGIGVSKFENLAGKLPMNNVKNSQTCVPCTEDCTPVILCSVNYARKNPCNFAIPQDLQNIPY
jgi:hypothetical protein